MIALPEPTIRDETFHPWASQVRQYPKVGKPGLGYEQHKVTIGEARYRPDGLGVADDDVLVEFRMTVDCLLYRNRKGHVVGILNYYPDEIAVEDVVFERAGNVNVFVRPDRRRRGIGTRLIEAATRRWSIDWTTQDYTTAGRALAAALIERTER